jgi:putative zinc finger protein
VNQCEFADSADIELYFYGELDAAARARVDAHVNQCADCARRLDDLAIIRRALATRPRVEAPPAGDWSGFMSRLNFRLKAEAANRNSWLATLGGASRTKLHRAAPWLAVAATLALATIAVLVSLRPYPPAQSAPVPAPADAPRTVAKAAEDPLLALSEQHLERSKLVVLGLATRDPDRTSPADWEYERQLAGSLLSDTRLYRRAAEQRGLTDVARVMSDLETVLLETSLGNYSDRDSLARVQRLIRKRDLVVKMQVIGSSGI